MTLTLQVSKLRTESLRLERTGAGGPTLVELGPSGGLSGKIRQAPDRIDLDHIVAALHNIGVLRVPVGIGRLEVPAASSLQQLGIDGRFDLSPQVEFRGTAFVADAVAAVAENFQLRGRHDAIRIHYVSMG